MFVSHPHFFLSYESAKTSSWFHLFYLIFTLWWSFLVGLHMSIISILWCMFRFTFITISRFFHLVRLLFVHLLLMSVDIWLDFTFVRAFFTFVLSQVFNCRNLVSSFVIAQWHLSNHICAAFITRIWRFVMNPGLMDEEKNFLSEAFATLSAEMCGHLSFNTCYQLVKGMMKTNSSQNSYSKSPNMQI